MDQRRQEEVVKQFKAGVYNTLVATSIGEEGLDIGEVDLIVCYDQKASPIRMLQRMGRTGRKRQGNILLLQMEGKEENDALQAKDAYEKMQDKISKGDEFNFHTDIARRIVPIEINPVVEMKHIEIPIENSQPELPVPRAEKSHRRRLTTSFVDMVNRMHLMDKSNAQDLENRFKSNLHMSDLEAGLSADEVSDELAEDDEDEGSQAIDLGTQDTEGEDEFEDYQLDSELADFIADDADPVDTFSSSLPSIKATVRHTKLFTSSQKDQEDSDDDDLPDISQLVRRKNPEPPRKTASKAMISDSEDEGSEEEVEIDARKPAKRRLVIDDSESE
ncbi:putative helicase c-terminal domain-containing protein [Neofusicoccum parvum UCRNP2]|uniref:ATP-dependent DNA helicase n=1 Tax=Botryosphaeria parva (strain UCR-NP2) TaxID=1287680 RepID=R1GMQ1_BOTPV|nr:putative helicase c-terminal domain-containing protein [Neofusicoccum parvum UCRNP2]